MFDNYHVSENPNLKKTMQTDNEAITLEEPPRDSSTGPYGGYKSRGDAKGFQHRTIQESKGRGLYKRCARGGCAAGGAAEG